MPFFILLSNDLLCKCTIFFFIHSPGEGYLGCIQVLAITNNAAMNIVEQMSLWYSWASFWYIPKSGIAGSWGRLTPNFLRNSHTDFQSGCTSLHYNQQWWVFWAYFIIFITIKILILNESKVYGNYVYSLFYLISAYVRMYVTN